MDIPFSHLALAQVRTAWFLSHSGRRWPKAG
jgi:hypothetical protein